MAIIDSKTFMEEGKRLLMQADNEVNRSREDVVTYGVCHNTRKAIAAFLNGFLVANGEQSADLPPDILLAQCAALDGRFANFDLTPILCKHETTDQNDCFCMAPEKVRECFQLAEQIGQIAATQTPAY